MSSPRKSVQEIMNIEASTSLGQSTMFAHSHGATFQNLQIARKPDIEKAHDRGIMNYTMSFEQMEHPIFVR